MYILRSPLQSIENVRLPSQSSSATKRYVFRLLMACKSDS